MIQSFVYAGSSGVVRQADGGRSIRFAPNLAREPVAFDADLLHPLRFREAVSALHDVVISDLRFVKKDKTAYLEWKKQQAARDAAVRREAYRQAEQAVAARMSAPLPAGFERDYDLARRQYWGVRDRYNKYLQLHDPTLWRQLMPCDPVITVADDVVFFECFSKDESAYGHLAVARADGFGASANLQLGTTNVDYSPDLYEEFQTLRTYRRTRFNLDPEGFTVKTGDAGVYREEKIDLPTSWLRGFMKLQAAMTMPATRVRLTREVVYSLLAFLKRHKARKSPRALRFELEPGRPPRLVLEPWEQRIESPGGPAYDGPPTAPIRIWGTRRLLVLARMLPLADSIDVCLLATGLPSFWLVRMGEMTFTLGLSGWTTNDWSAGSALDLLQPPRSASVELIDRTAAFLKARRAADLASVKTGVGETDDFLVAGAAASGAVGAGDLRPRDGAVPLPADHAPAARRGATRAGRPGTGRGAGADRAAEVRADRPAGRPQPDAGDHRHGREQAGRDPGRPRRPDQAGQVRLRALPEIRLEKRPLPAHDRPPLGRERSRFEDVRGERRAEPAAGTADVIQQGKTRPPSPRTPGEGRGEGVCDFGFCIADFRLGRRPGSVSVFNPKSPIQNPKSQAPL